MKFQDNMLSATSHAQKDKYCMTSLYVKSQIVNFLHVESRTVITRGWRREKRAKEGCWSKVTYFQSDRRSCNGLLHCMMTTVNNIYFKSVKTADFRCSHHKQADEA